MIVCVPEPIEVTPAFRPFQSLGDLTVSAFFDDTRTASPGACSSSVTIWIDLP